MIALLATIPISAATWGGRGFYEPDTEYDEKEGFMFFEPDQSSDPGVRQVYFSTFSGFFIETSNANSAVLGSNVMTYPTNIHAFLGVWKDCNADGYIGSIETALLEYRSELLLDASICPAQPGLDVHADGYQPTHNDGQWVREFLWIGPDYIAASTTETGCFWTPTARECTRRENATNPYNIADEGARIWADWGIPSDAPKASCPVNPRPRGTYQSTGGALRYADCFTNWRITGTINDVAAETGLSQLSFGDAAYNRPDQSGSVLNQKNPYGQQDDASYATVWDCSAEPTYVKNPTGAQPATPVSNDGSRKGFYIPAPTFGKIYVNYTDDQDNLHPHSSLQGPNPDVGHGINQLGSPSVNPAGSPAGTVNETLEGGAADCDRSSGTGTNSNVYDLDESDFEASPLVRVRTDIMYTFFEGTRAHTKSEDIAEQAINDVFGEGTPQDDFGVGLASPLTSTPAWFGSPGYVFSRNPYVNRDNLQPWGAVYVSAYAKVTRTDVQVPGSGIGTYGSEHCAGTEPITGAYQCDPLQWYPWASVAKVGYPNARNLWHAVVGDTYNLKDTDCYDASPSKYLEGVGTSMIGGDVCLRPATPSVTELVS